MILRWLISFSLLAQFAGGATVTGMVSLVDSKESSVRKKRDFSGVVIWLEPATAPATPAKAAPRAQILQKNKRFSPHILAVPAGTVVDFPNMDPIFHNAFSNFDGKVFDIGLYAPGTSRGVRLDRPGVVRVFCNIHPTMSAVIAVLPSPYFASSDRDGRFQILNVPAGEYTLHVIHERATAATLQALTRKLNVTESLPPQSIAISESGYLPVLHKNKYGKDYPPEPDKSYPGAGR